MSKNDMRYTKALKMLAEIKEGRPDILEVKFNSQDDSFDVLHSDGTTHICFMSEFKKDSVSETTVEKVVLYNLFL